MLDDFRSGQITGRRRVSGGTIARRLQQVTFTLRLTRPEIDLLFTTAAGQLLDHSDGEMIISADI
jgi:hypothetical protein